MLSYQWYSVVAVLIVIGVGLLFSYITGIVTLYSNYKKYRSFNKGIKHGFSCINVCLIPREMLKAEAEGRGFQQLPRDLANVNALENNV